MPPKLSKKPKQKQSYQIVYPDNYQDKEYLNFIYRTKYADILRFVNNLK